MHAGVLNTKLNKQRRQVLFLIYCGVHRHNQREFLDNQHRLRYDAHNMSSV